MKKQIKILSIILLVVMALATLTTVVTAAPDLSPQIKDMANGNGNGPTAVTDLGKTIVTIMQTVRNSSCSCCIINIRYQIYDR